MPSLLKERPTGRLGRLISALRPARAGPLPVQTGFPTSLADLFVKNHGRLKKPSSYASATCRRKKRGATALPSPAPSPPPPSPPPSPPPAAVCPPPTQPRPDLPLAEPVCRPGGRAPGLGLGFLALVGVVSLALLVIWTRKVVAAVTVAAFSLFLLESVKPSWLDRRPRPSATKEVDFGGRGYVSPIREVEAESEPPGSSFSDSGRGIHVSNLDIEERIEEGADSCSWPAKPKKRSRWKKLIPRKLQKGRIGKGPDSLSSSFRSESSLADSILDGNATPDSRRGRRNHQADAKAASVPKSPDSSGPLRDGVDAEVRNNGAPIEIGLAGVDDIGGGGSRRFPFVAVMVVVLVGLVAGRLPAVALTVLCSALVSKLQRLRRCQLGIGRGGD